MQIPAIQSSLRRSQPEGPWLRDGELSRNYVHPPPTTVRPENSRTLGPPTPCIA